MTEFDANRLLTIIVYNFAAFLPADPHGAAIKKGSWLAELVKYDKVHAEKAVMDLVQTCHYPPQIADFRDRILPSLTREDPRQGLPGPVYGTQEGFEAMYTADPDHIERVMAQLYRDLG